MNATTTAAAAIETVAKELQAAHASYDGSNRELGGLYGHLAEALAAKQLIRTEKDTRDGSQPTAGESTPLADAVAMLGALPVPIGPEVPVAPILVYRVDYDGHMKCGLYSNVEAAKAHCQGVVSDEYPADQALFFEWSVDEYDASVLELAVRLEDESVSTLYTVTTLSAEHAFDPDAEW